MDTCYYWDLYFVVPPLPPRGLPKPRWTLPHANTNINQYCHTNKHINSNLHAYKYFNTNFYIYTNCNTNTNVHANKYACAANTKANRK